MASLYKRNGIYYVGFSNSKKQPHNKQISLKTRYKDIANSRAARLKLEYEKGIYDPWDRQNTPALPNALGGAVRAFLLTRSNLSSQTIMKYRSVLGLLERQMGSKCEVSRITQDDIGRFLDSTPKEAITKRTYSTTLSPFFNWLLAEGVVKRNPVSGIRLPRVSGKRVRMLSRANVDAIVAEIEQATDSSEHSGVGTSKWLIPIIKSNVYLGLRAGELVNLKWDHVDLVERTVLIEDDEDFKTKTGKSRTIPLCREVVRIIEEIEHKSEYVYSSHTQKRLGRQYLSRRFKVFSRRAGLPEWVCFHTTRHTACSWLAISGVPIEAIRMFAGHSSVSVTQRYMHLTPDIYHDLIRKGFS